MVLGNKVDLENRAASFKFTSLPPKYLFTVKDGFIPRWPFPIISQPYNWPLYISWILADFLPQPKVNNELRIGYLGFPFLITLK